MDSDQAVHELLSPAVRSEVLVSLRFGDGVTFAAAGCDVPPPGPARPGLDLLEAAR